MNKSVKLPKVIKNGNVLGFNIRPIGKVFGIYAGKRLMSYEPHYKTVDLARTDCTMLAGRVPKKYHKKDLRRVSQMKKQLI